MKDKKVTEFVTMRKETVDRNIRSWLCSTQVDSSSDVNLWLVVNRLEIGLINLILGCILVSISFIHSLFFPSMEWERYFNRPNYLKWIRQQAMAGELRPCRFRSICWRVRALALFLSTYFSQRSPFISKMTFLKSDRFFFLFYFFWSFCLFIFFYFEQVSSNTLEAT